MSDNKESEPHNIEYFYKDHVDINGLGIPFAGCVVSKSSMREDQQLRRHDSPYLVLDGDWKVIETSKKGFPTVLIREGGDAAVAATLDIISNSNYNGALLGYDPDIGTFGLGTTYRKGVNELFQDKIDCFADSCDFEELKPILESGLERTPVGIVRKSNTSNSESQYRHNSLVSVWAQAEEYRPWAIIESMHLEGFRTLIERFETAATAIKKEFDTTPPWIDTSDTEPKSKGDPESARELKDKFDHFFEDTG